MHPLAQSVIITLKNRLRLFLLILLVTVVATGCISESKPEATSGQLTTPIPPANRPTGGSDSTLLEGGQLISINGTLLFVKIVGQGMPVLVLHGGPGMNYEYFFPQLPQLLQDSVQLIFFDQRATGRSAFGVDSTQMHMADLVADIEALRVHFGWSKINLMGHSWGCVLAMWYARSHPEKLGSLLLMNGTGAELPASWDGQAALRERMGQEGYEALYYITQSPAFQRGVPQALDNYYRTLFRASFFHQAMADSLRLYFPKDYLVRARFMMHLYPDLQAYNLLPAMKRVNCKALVLHGSHELTPAREMEAVANALPGGRFVLLPDCGHFAFIESPGAVRKEILNFLYSIR